MCAPIFLAHITCFLKARCLQEPGIRISTGFLSLSCLLPKVSNANVRWVIANHTFSSHLKSLNWHFLACHKLPLQINAIQLGQGILKGFPNLWIKIDCCLSDDSFWTILQALLALDCILMGSLHFDQCNSADLPCYRNFCSRYLNLPLPVGMHLKVSPKGRHIFDRLYYLTA